MKKITLLFALLISSIGFSQEIVTPVYEGTFDGTTYSQTFNFPTGAQSWAGFANNNVSIYPLSYPNGGQISFKATVATNAEIKFVFEKDLYPNVAPSVSTVNVALLATNPANTVYTVAIPANATNTYKSALMYVVTRDVAVSLSEIKLIKFDTDGTTQLKVDFPIYDGTFDGTTYSQTFNFPTGAQNWAGFANNNTTIYPLSFTNGGKVSFKATVATNAEIKFVFEKDLYPNVTPSVSTANVALLATNPANTLYEVAIPANTTNTYKSALMYVITRDVEVSLSEIKIHTNAATPPPTATYDLPFDFETSPVTSDWEGFEGALITVEAVAAPQTTGNSSTNLAKIIRNGGQTYAGVVTTVDTALDFSTKSTITARIWTSAPIGTKIMFKTEEAGNAGNNSGEKNVFTTKTGEWEDLVFDFAGVTKASQTRIVIIPDNGNLGDGSAASTFYFDDIIQVAPVVAYDLPFDFETSPVTSDWEGFEGAVITVEAVAAPQTTGNSSTNLAKIIRNGGQTYAGVVTTVDTALDFSTKSTITARIWTSAPIGTKIMFKTEEAGNAGNNSGEKNVFTTKTGEWEDLVFDFAGVTKASQTRIVIIPDNGNLGDGSATSTFYFDDIIQTAAGANNTAECAGNSSEAQQGSFSADYSYGFETLTNGDVRLTFAMPSGTPGLVAYAWKQTPFAETSMTVSGTVATLDIAGYSNGESISYAVKFAWAAGGFGVTKYFTYIVGNDCATAIIDKNNLLEISLYPNPASNRLNISAANTIQNAEIYNVLGKKVMNVTINKTSESIDISNLASGVYMIKYNIENSIGTAKFIKQ